MSVERSVCRDANPKLPDLVARSSHPPLGGSWVVLSGVISPLIWVIRTVTLLITPFITTHEPPGLQPRWSSPSFPES